MGRDYRPKRRDHRLNPASLELLRFVARHYLAITPQIAAKFTISEDAARRRLSRLADRGLVTVDRPLTNAAPKVCITPAGLRAIGSTHRVVRRGTEQFNHDVGLGWLALAAERGALGPLRAFVTEREMHVRDSCGDATSDPTKRFAIGFGTPGPTGHPQAHYADMLLTTASGRVVAIELELSAKGEKRLDGVMRSYAGESRVDDVLYLVPNRRIGAPIIAAAKRAGIEAQVHVQLIGAGGEIVGTPSRSIRRVAAGRTGSAFTEHAQSASAGRTRNASASHSRNAQESSLAL